MGTSRFSYCLWRKGIQQRIVFADGEGGGQKIKKGGIS
jgi:hypothetical protein